MLTIGAPGIEPAAAGLVAWAAASEGLGGLMARLSTSSPSEKAGAGACVGALPEGLEGRRSLKKSSDAIATGSLIGQTARPTVLRSRDTLSQRAPQRA